MRPTARPQSALRTPLNGILGTEVHIRVLRALTETPAPISGGELARRTLLQPSSVHRAIKALEGLGLITFVGSGPRSQVELRRSHPLAPAIESLFRAESGRADTIVSRLRDVAASLRPPPLAVWVEGPIAMGRDAAGDPIEVTVLDNASGVARASDAMRAAVEGVERDLDVTVDVRGVTPADLAAREIDDPSQIQEVLPLLGVPRFAFVGGGTRSLVRKTMRSHADLDARARAVAGAVAKKLVRDPSLVVRAKEYVGRRLKLVSSGERNELQEWDRILRTMSPARLRHFLVDGGERATRLRQTSPFAGVLSNTEREAALADAIPPRRLPKPPGSRRRV